MKYFSNKVLDEKIKKGGGGGGEGVDHLYKLEDVYVNFTTGRVKTAAGADVSDGQALVWNNGLSKWVAGTVGGSGGTYTADEETLHLDENNEFSISNEYQGQISNGQSAYSTLNDWFEEVNLGTAQNPAWALVLKKRNGSLPRAFLSYGDQIVGDGTPGGGDVPVHYLNDLTDVVITSPSNGQALVYQNGEWVNGSAIPDLSNYYTKQETNAQISSAITALNLGAAATYGVTTSISSGSDNSHLATGKAVYDYVSLAITSALKYRGITTTDIKTNPTQNPIIINGSSYTAVAGDVVLMDGSSKEYLWNGSSWQELGDETSYVLKTQTINGYALSGNITLGISDIIGSNAVGSASKPIYYTGSAFAEITDLNLLNEASGHGYAKAKRFVLFSQNGTERDSGRWRRRGWLPL